MKSILKIGDIDVVNLRHSPKEEHKKKWSYNHSTNEGIRNLPCLVKFLYFTRHLIGSMNLNFSFSEITL